MCQNTPMPTTSLDQIGAYLLPGRVTDPRLAIGQAQTAEHLGLGTVWISERYGTKDVAAIGGAVAQATHTVKIATGISHYLFRHPLAQASMAMTLQALSNGRFMLGVGRSVAPTWRAAGFPPMSNQILIDSADIHRRLCAGEKVRYDGPAGKFPALKLGDLPAVPPPPLLLAAMGPNTLTLAGRHYDGVILHPFLTVDAVARSAAIVRGAASEAGRDPTAVKVYATVVTAPDVTSDHELAIVGGRAVTYYQIPAFGDLLAAVNQWDVNALTAFRAHPMLVNLRGAADDIFTKEQLAEVSRALPQHWLSEASAVGTAAHCAARLQDYLAAGADEIIIHGAVPELLGPLAQHFAARQD